MSLRFRFGISFLSILLMFGNASAALATTVPSGFEVDTVVSGLSLPTALAFAPDGRIFIAQKSGAVREVKNGVLQSTPVVQLPDLNDYGDRGLEGIALDPNFAQNGYLYLAYTYENTPGQNYQGPKTGRIVRLTVSGDTASLASEVVLVGSVGGDASNPSCNNFAVGTDCIPSDSSAHSMGDLRFGPDGKLYASVGDGAGYLSVDSNALHAQDVRWLSGKILRINTDGTGPSDNPFYDGNAHDNQSKVFSLGHRNSYRFNWGPDGTMYIGEVGWATWEEIDIGKKGANYGWPCREGYVATSYNCTTSSLYTDPIYVYDHSSGSGSVIGGIVLGNAYPAQYQGQYVFGDYSNSYLKLMTLNANHTVAAVNDFVTAADGPVDIEQGPDGVLYYLSINTGQLRKIVYSSANQPPVAAMTANPTQGQSPLLVHFSGANAYDPNGDALTYSWNFGDGASGSGATVDHTYSADGTYTATLTVTDTHGASDSTQATITVGGATAPDAAPHHVSTSITPTPTHIGDQTTITTDIRNDGPASPFIIDIEVYDASNTRVGQKVFDGATIPQGATSAFSYDWQPPAIGDYTVKVGLFKSGWAGLYEWTDRALGFSILARTPTSGGTPAFSQSTSATTPVAVNQEDPITASITDTGGAGSALVDLEVYDSTGAKVGQQFFDNESFAAGQTKTYSYRFVPQSAGTYAVSIGAFAPGWSSLYNWFTDTTNITATGGSGSTPAVIYDDALASGWENWSWGSTVNFADTAQKSQGADSMRIAYDAAWGGLYLHGAQGVSTSGRTTLTFDIAGAGALGQKMQIYLFDQDGTALPTKNLSAYTSGGIKNGVFTPVSIPLSDLGASNRTIGGIVIQDASGSAGSSINVDNLRLQ